jgi:hypothetical protein
MVGAASANQVRDPLTRTVRLGVGMAELSQRASRRRAARSCPPSLKRNETACLEGWASCDLAPLTTAQTAAVEASRLRRNYFAAFTNCLPVTRRPCAHNKSQSLLKFSARASPAKDRRGVPALRMALATAISDTGRPKQSRSRGTIARMAHTFVGTIGLLRAAAETDSQ